MIVKLASLNQTRARQVAKCINHSRGLVSIQLDGQDGGGLEQLATLLEEMASTTSSTPSERRPQEIKFCNDYPARWAQEREQILHTKITEALSRWPFSLYKLHIVECSRGMVNAICRGLTGHISLQVVSSSCAFYDATFWLPYPSYGPTKIHEWSRACWTCCQCKT